MRACGARKKMVLLIMLILITACASPAVFAENPPGDEYPASQPVHEVAQAEPTPEPEQSGSHPSSSPSDVDLSPNPPSATPATGFASQSPDTHTPTPVETSSPQNPPSGSPKPSASPSNEAAIMLNNRLIITVRGDSGHTAQERAEIVESRLDEVLRKALELPNVRIIIVDNTPVIESKGVYIISVTNSDAAPTGSTVAELAASWRDSMETSLRKAWLENRSDYHKVAIYRTMIIIAVTVLLNLFGVMLMRRYLKITGFFFSVLIWLVAVCAIMWQFPIARPYGKSLMHGIIVPALLLSLISFIVIILFKPADIFIERYFGILEKLRRKDEGQDKRLAHRITMLRILMAMVLKGGLILTGFLIFMNSLNINIATVLAGAGVVGVAVGLATQDLMKDFVAGFFIAFEDQFAVGDVIRTNTLTGTVEDFTFRITRLRDTEGRLITIPNSTIRTVENLSSGWSQVDFVVSVAYRTDLAKAMDLMLDTAKTLKGEWPDVIIEEPQLLGVDQLGESAINLRMLLKTTPLQQWRVKRELLLRIRNRFDSEGIEIPFPQLTVSMKASGEPEKKKSAETPEE